MVALVVATLLTGGSLALSLLSNGSTVDGFTATGAGRSTPVASPTAAPSAAATTVSPAAAGSAQRAAHICFLPLLLK
jgi:hypothetical protein